MRVDIAQPREVATVLTLVEDLLAELGGEGQEFASIQRDKLQADIESDPGRRFLALLARDESGTAVGVLTLSESFALYAGGKCGAIAEMYVRPEHRGLGIGARLLETAVVIAEERGWHRLEVTGPADPWDGRAVRFYERLGFRFTGPKLRLLV
jgi:GNAT superfamily N-acetyltransferase